MSRIGKMPVSLPKGVTVTIDPSNLVTVKGPKGELKQQFPGDITLDRLILSDPGQPADRPEDASRAARLEPCLAEQHGDGRQQGLRPHAGRRGRRLPRRR